MNNIDWSKAPEGATEIVQDKHMKCLRWATKTDVWLFIEGGWDYRDKGWETIATREPEQPRKTVKDAVEYFGETFIAGKWSHIRSDKTCKMFFATGEVESENWRDSYLVCTCEEFEDFVAAKAKSEPEWTHIDGDNCECKIMHTIEGLAWVSYRDRELPDELWALAELEVIKPKITKAEAWDLFVNEGWNTADIMDKHEVVE